MICHFTNRIYRKETQQKHSFTKIVTHLHFAANICLIVVLVVHFLTYTIPTLVIGSDQAFINLSRGGKWAMGITMPNMGLFMGCKVLTVLEANGLGLQWDTVTQNVYETTKLSMMDIFWMLIVDIVMYLVIMWYLEGIMPGKFGVARKYYFPFQVRMS